MIAEVRCVVGGQPLAHIVCAYPHTRVGASVVGGFATQQHDPDEPLLELIDVAFESVLDNMAKKLAALRAGAEGRALADNFDGCLQFRGKSRKFAQFN